MTSPLPGRPQSHWRMWAVTQLSVSKGTPVPPAVHRTDRPAQSVDGVGEGSGWVILNGLRVSGNILLQHSPKWAPLGVQLHAMQAVVPSLLINTGRPPLSGGQLSKAALLGREPVCVPTVNPAASAREAGHYGVNEP